MPLEKRVAQGTAQRCWRDPWGAGFRPFSAKTPAIPRLAGRVDQAGEVGDHLCGFSLAGPERSCAWNPTASMPASTPAHRRLAGRQAALPAQLADLLDRVPLAVVDGTAASWPALSSRLGHLVDDVDLGGRP